MQQDFSLVSDSDTLLPSLVHRVANGKKDVYEYLVAFRQIDDNNSLSGNVQILYEDKIFGLGKQIFLFKKQEVFAATNKTN
jgi:hypothetical protein